MRRPTRRQLILMPATILVVAGFLWFVASVFGGSLFGSSEKYIWIHLPFRDYRIRLMYNEWGDLQIRTFFGVWHDTTIHNYINPLTLMLGGYAFLLGLIPDRLRRQRAQERIAAGHCGQCNYNLTANTTGICPECGTRVKLGNMESNA